VCTNNKKILAKHIPTGEVYPAITVLERANGTAIFRLVGERAHAAICLCQSDNLEVDTLFEESWTLIDGEILTF
jgi:hypothetical protein